MIKSLKKLTKGLILAVGTLVVVAALGLGGAGIYYKNDAVNTYAGLRDQVLNITNGVTATLKETKDVVNKLFIDGTGSLEAVEKQLNDAYKKVSEIKQQNQNQQIQAQTQEILNMIDTAMKSIRNVLNNELSEENKQNIINAVEEYTGVATNVATQINDFANDLDPPKFTATYDAVTISMTAVSAAILGVIIITTILQFTFYKNIDGVSVRRTNAKKDITKHIEKIRKKYPNL